MDKISIILHFQNLNLYFAFYQLKNKLPLFFVNFNIIYDQSLLILFSLAVKD